MQVVLLGSLTLLYCLSLPYFASSALQSVQFDAAQSSSSTADGIVGLALLGWFAAGSALLVPSVQKQLTRRLARVRNPTPGEWEQLWPVWQELADTLDINPRQFNLLMFDDQVPPAGTLHRWTLLVSTFTVENTTPEELQAVLAHTLVHHTDRHTAMITIWRIVTLPPILLFTPTYYGIRLLWRAVTFLTRAVWRGYRIASKAHFPVTLVGFQALIVLSLVVGAAAVLLTLSALLFLGILLFSLVTLFLFVGYSSFAAGMRRWLEYRADAVAVAAEFGPMLYSLLSNMPRPENKLQIKDRVANPIPKRPRRLKRIELRLEGAASWQRDMEAATAHYGEGSYGAAIDRCNQAVWTARRLRDRLLEGEALHALAAAEAQLQVRQARSEEQVHKLRDAKRKHLRRAIKLYKALEDPRLNQVLTGLAQLEKVDATP